MNKRERVLATLKGQEVDRVATGFWMHFPPEHFFGEAAVKAHMSYFKETDTDVCKVMTEHLYPCDHSIHSATDWKHLPSYNRKADFIQKQASIISEVAERLEDGVLMSTIHGVVASASHTLLGIPRYDSIGRYAQLYHLRTNPRVLSDAYRRIADTLCVMTQESVKAGAEGIYYAALGGESDGFTDEEHAEYIAPLEKMIIGAAYEAGAHFVVLHMCKPLVNIKRFQDYPCDIVNWGVEESGVTLNEGKKVFPEKVLLGGMCVHDGVLLRGCYHELEEEVHGLIRQVGSKGFILGSDCTLPGDLAYERIAWAAKACESYRG